MTETEFRAALADLFPLAYRDIIRNAENQDQRGFFMAVFSDTRIRSEYKMKEYSLDRMLPLHFVKDDGWVVQHPDYLLKDNRTGQYIPLREMEKQ